MKDADKKRRRKKDDEKERRRKKDVRNEKTAGRAKDEKLVWLAGFSPTPRVSHIMTAFTRVHLLNLVLQVRGVLLSRSPQPMRAHFQPRATVLARDWRSGSRVRQKPKSRVAKTHEE